MKNSGQKTAAELDRELAANPKWVEEKKERDAYWEQVRARNREEEKPLLDELVTHGFTISRVGDLVMRKKPYPAAIPILMKHLLLPHSDNIKDVIARSLAVPDAAYLHDQLVEEYRKQASLDSAHGKESSAIQGLALAVAATTLDSNLQSLVAIVQDGDFGSSRLLLLKRLARSKRSDISELLGRLSNDPVFSKEIASWKRGERKGG